jgi:hypothetical protein
LAEPEIRQILVLEFLGLRDEYSETDLEDALVRHLEAFLLELGNDFAFVGRQRRLRIDDEWYRVDLLFFHRRLRCLVILDLKLGRFTHADAGQMHLYLNYAREHWVQTGENPPVGVILCSGKSEAVVHYATDALPNKVLVREYLTALPEEKLLADELERTRRELEARLVHTPDVKHRLKAAGQLLAQIRTRYDTMEEALQAMARVQVNASRLTEYLPEVFKPSDPTDDAALIRAERNRDWAEHFFDEGRGNRLRGVRGTLWAAFNGVAELLDHRKTRQNPHQRLSSIWFGDNYRVKVRAFSLAQEKMEVWQN